MAGRGVYGGGGGVCDRTSCRLYLCGCGKRTSFCYAVPWNNTDSGLRALCDGGEKSAEVSSLLPFASHIHARGGAPDQLQTAADENAIDFPGMLAGLKRLDYDGYLALEYVWIDWKGCNRTDNVSETLLLRRSLEATLSDAISPITRKQ